MAAGDSDMTQAAIWHCAGSDLRGNFQQKLAHRYSSVTAYGKEMVADLGEKLERETGFEPATSTLARLRSTN